MGNESGPSRACTAHGAAAGLGVASAAEAEALLAQLAKESRYSKDVWG